MSIDHVECAAILRQTAWMRILASLLFSLFWAGPALASSSAWQGTAGGAVRLVTTGLPDRDGKLEGILEIRLDPGWKTYWRDPGASGVPPALDIGDAGTVEMRYPAPEWHHDGQFDWAGYTQSVGFPVTLTLNRSGPIEAKAFIGICETICIPLQAELKLDPASDPDGTGDARRIADAAALLPAKARADFGVSVAASDEHALVLDAALPTAEGAELFLAGGDGYQFGKPHPVQAGGKHAFRVKILSRPKSKPAGEGLHYTLVTPAGAVSGVLPYF